MLLSWKKVEKLLKPMLFMLFVIHKWMASSVCIYTHIYIERERERERERETIWPQSEPKCPKLAPRLVQNCPNSRQEGIQSPSYLRARKYKHICIFLSLFCTSIGWHAAKTLQYQQEALEAILYISSQAPPMKDLNIKA